MPNTGYNGLLGLLILIGDVWAIINIFQSSASNGKKLLWTVVVLAAASAGPDPVVFPRATRRQNVGRISWR